MTVSAPLPASRDELPRDTAGLAVIDQQFDLVAVYRTTMAEAAVKLHDSLVGASPAKGLVSWDSLSDAKAAADLIGLMTSALPIMSHLEAAGSDLDAFAHLLTAIVNCRPLSDELACIHELTDDAFPVALHPLCLDLDDCPNLGDA